jgi:hypothetical protein
MMKLGVKELIKLCIYCWGHPLLYTCSGSVAVWMLLSGNLQQDTLSSDLATRVKSRTRLSSTVTSVLCFSQQRPAIPTIAGASSVSIESASTRYRTTAATLRPSHFTGAIGLPTTPTGCWYAPSVVRSGRDSTRARISTRYRLID